MVSIFLLIIVIIISQAIHVHTNKKIIEGWLWWNRKRQRQIQIQKQKQKQAVADRKAAVEAARLKYLNLVSQFTNPRQTPYVNLLGTAYINDQTQSNLNAYQQAIQIDNLAKNTTPCNNDNDIAKIIKLTSDILSGNSQNSTKVYYISEVVIKALDHFYNYNIQNNETQYNYISSQFSKTLKDDDKVKKKYFKIISLISLGHISKSTTSSSLPAGSNYFKKISEPILSEAKKIIDELNKIVYDLSDSEKQEIENKYKVIVS